MALYGKKKIYIYAKPFRSKPATPGTDSRSTHILCAGASFFLSVCVCFVVFFAYLNRCFLLAIDCVCFSVTISGKQSRVHNLQNERMYNRNK